MAFKPIEILINAKDNASSVFTSLQGKVAAVGAAIATYFGISAFAGMVKGAADFEQGMSRVQAATGATAEEFAALKKAAEDVGAAGAYSSVEAAGALENLAKAGLNATEAIEALPAVLNLAQAGDVGLAESAEYVTKAVAGMGLPSPTPPAWPMCWPSGPTPPTPAWRAWPRPSATPPPRRKARA